VTAEVSAPAPDVDVREPAPLGRISIDRSSRTNGASNRCRSGMPVSSCGWRDVGDPW